MSELKNIVNQSNEARENMCNKVGQNLTEINQLISLGKNGHYPLFLMNG